MGIDARWVDTLRVDGAFSGRGEAFEGVTKEKMQDDKPRPKKNVATLTCRAVRRQNCTQRPHVREPASVNQWVAWHWRNGAGGLAPPKGPTRGAVSDVTARCFDGPVVQPPLLNNITNCYVIDTILTHNIAGIFRFIVYVHWTGEISERVGDGVQCHQKADNCSKQMHAQRQVSKLSQQ